MCMPGFETKAMRCLFNTVKRVIEFKSQKTSYRVHRYKNCACIYKLTSDDPDSTDTDLRIIFFLDL